jgi:hypothetical protein
MRRVWAGFIFTAGLILLGVAVLAEQIGLDNDPGWGTGRYGLFVGGVVLVVCAALAYRAEQVQLHLRRLEALVLGWLNGLKGSPLFRAVRRFTTSLYRLPAFHTRERRGRFALMISLVFSLAAVWWYATAGTMTAWFPYPHTYYDRLAEAFRHGQLALLEQPDESLRSIPDPYPYENRQNARYLWDVSYYNGRFYLYWGATPALVLAAVKTVIKGVIEDQVLAIGFLLGIAGLLPWIGYRLWQVVPSPLRAGYLLVFLPSLSLNLYLLWPTGRPGVYEAAILGGQFFLLAGIAALIEAVYRPQSGWGWYLVAGAALGLAIGSRMTLLVSALWLVVLVLWLNRVRFGGRLRPFLTASAAFAMPVLLAIGLVMAYNAARFGNPLESGLSYQLGIAGYPPERSWLFSTRYLLPNLYHYLLRPPLWQAEFPFVVVPFIPETRWPSFIRLPEHYIAHESQAGWLSVFPLLVILPGGVVLLWRWLRPYLTRKGLTTAVESGVLPLQGWLLLALLGSGLAQTFILLMYFFPSMRFQIEIVPLLSLSAWLTLLWLQAELRSRRWLRPLLTAVMVTLACYGLAVGLLGGFAAGEQLFEEHNPLLFQQIGGWFNHLWTR